MNIHEDSPVDAWKAATAYLLNCQGHETYNLLVSFPGQSAQDESPLVEHDPRSLLGAGFDRGSDVANTLFPSKTWTNVDTRSDLYARYIRAHTRSRRRSWGTYFLRFIEFGQRKVNQLERVVVALETWRVNHRAVLLMHTSSAETDNFRTRGGPCLQYVQFNCPNSNLIDLTAVYRNQDFCNKALANYFGLARILNFVCGESGRQIGHVSCLSVHAYFNTSTANQKLLAGIQ